MLDVMDPVATFQNLYRGWWKIVLLAVIGGLLGLVVSLLLPPLYQAEATFHASIDFTQVNFENMVDQYGDPLMFTQYDEDLALQVVERVLLAERQEAHRYAKTLDPSLDGKTFYDNFQIQRYLGRWHLNYRHQDPKIAQDIVNYWADIGMDALVKAQETGQAESFVIISKVSDAELPQTPLYQNRAVLLLTGTIIGFLCGIILVDFKARFVNRQVAEA